MKLPEQNSVLPQGGEDNRKQQQLGKQLCSLYRVQLAAGKAGVHEEELSVLHAALRRCRRAAEDTYIWINIIKKVDFV